MWLRAVAAAAVLTGAGPAWARTHALLVNGGGSAADNFASHVEHLREALGLLERAGVPRANVSILASDGQDPRADVAHADDAPDGAWWLAGTALGKSLAPGLRFENTRLPGWQGALRPATRAGVAAWFAGARTRLRAGDTLWLYVTDHGSEARRGDRGGNRITLWGRAGLSVAELRGHLGQLPRGVRVVMVMSQCFSGGFARLHDVADVCGYFSTTADRPAYGCFPESRGESRVGHSFELFAAWPAAGGDLAKAHEAVLVADETPDVPLRTSDVFLRDVLEAAARRARVSPDAFAERWLDRRPSPREDAAEDATIDAIARRFGLPPPTSLAALDATVGTLEARLADATAARNAWEEALDESAQGNLERFFGSAAGRRLARRYAATALRNLDGPARARRLRELLAALVPASEARQAHGPRLEALDEKAAAARQLAYELEVRLAAALRLRFLLLRKAALAYVAAGSEPAATRTLARLARCEAFALPLPAAGKLPAEEPMAPVARTERQASALRPSFLGVRFRNLRGGAARIEHVQPGSPAARAGIRAGDVVTGAGGAPFEDRGDLNAATKLAPAGVPMRLAIARGARRLGLVVTPVPAPPARR